ncbi:MAG TPA: GH3 auxin-responsive promoter family protein [Lacipirellulaceae bacterium]|nr:GH3 auxin-responsive promoter family protein [Lacipirellulaceae bacterium]
MVARYIYLAWLRSRLRRFLADSRRARDFQHRALIGKIRRHAESDFGRDYGFGSINSVEDFRRRVPVMTYEDHQPYVARVLAGDLSALFAPGTKLRMFAMTSGTTGEPKRLPITDELFREYRAGWRLWGAGVYGDHRSLLHKKALQLTSDWQQYRAPSGAPCGQISGLAASSRPKISNRIFLPPPAAGRIHDAAAKHYAALRFALESSRVGMIITANPSTLIELARRADRESESLVRDIHDGTLSCEAPPDVRAALARRIARRRPRRARQLAALVERHGALVPKHAWPMLDVLAVWTGGSVGVFLPQLADLYGDTAVRDHGLSASEGRMTIPLADGTSAGILDFYHNYFEFIPIEEHGSDGATALEAHELEEGREYFILLTTSGGLYRYDIHDVVRCVGFEGQAPLLEFLNKGKSFANVTGEKLSEYQVIEAVEQSFRDLGLAIDAFTLAPVMEDKPRYVLLVEPQVHRGRAAELAKLLQRHLEKVNEEYAEKCASGRLLSVQVREVPAGTWNSLRREKTGRRGNFEEYKQPCLVGELDFVDRLARPKTTATAEAAAVDH